MEPPLFTPGELLCLGSSLAFSGLFYYLYRKKTRVVARIQEAPKLQVDDDLPALVSAADGRCLPYVALEGIVLPAKAVLTSHYHERLQGVIQKLLLKEHRLVWNSLARSWSESERVLSEQVYTVPFLLASPDTEAVTQVSVESPLRAVCLPLEVVYESPAGEAAPGSPGQPGAGAPPAMAYRELVRRWHQGVLAADGGDWDTALDTFAGIPGPPARICFNMGCVHLLAGRPEAALRAFDDTIAKDSSLAVAFFQRGFVHLQLGRYEEALSDYHMAFSHLRKNPFIDYKQLGLRHILYAWEVLYSTAAAQCQLQQWQEARVTLDKAVVWRPEGRTGILDLALQQVQNRLFLEPMQVPLGEFFRPRKKEVEQLDSKDFLGKPKVISSIIPNDEYIGFEPLRPQKQGFYEPSADALLDSESGYYRVLSHYYPEDSEKLAVGASSLVFVLARGGDGWATAIHDGQKLRIPSSLLEPASKMDKGKISDGIPLPPAQVPPSRLHVKQKPESSGGENAPENGAGAQVDSKQIPATCRDASPSTDRPVVLRVCCECTVVLRAGAVPALQDLRALLQERLGQQVQRGRLSYRNSDGKELGAVSGEEDLERMWQQLTDGRLVLCCQDSESHLGRPVLYRMLAQHSYPAQGPGDLDFSKGDVLDVLSEVNEDWLEGHCNGKTGIFPKCFATQTSCGAAFL